MYNKKEHSFTRKCFFFFFFCRISILAVPLTVVYLRDSLSMSIFNNVNHGLKDLDQYLSGLTSTDFLYTVLVLAQLKYLGYRRGFVRITQEVHQESHVNY